MILTEPVFTSAKLTELTQKREPLSAKAKQLHAEGHRLSKLLHSSAWYDSTVVRVTDVDAPTAAFIGIKSRPDQASVVATGTSELDHAARQQDAVRRVLAGERLTSAPTETEQLEMVRRELGAIEAAIRTIDREIARERDVIAARYAKSFKATHDKEMAAVYASALEFHANWSKADKSKRHLIESGVGLREGMYLNMPDSFLNFPNNPWSDFASWLAAARRDGFIKEVPDSLRMKVAAK